MSDNSVFIEGLGQGLPTWSTEATQAGIKREIQKQNVYGDAMTKLLAKLVTGDKNIGSALSGLKNEMKSVKDSVVKTDKTERENFQKQNDYFRQQLTLTDRLVGRVDGLIKKQDDIAAAIKEDKINNLVKEGMSQDDARFKVEGDSFFKHMAEATGDVAGIISGIAAVTAGMNGFLAVAAEERFDFAQELRQSGLAAGLTSASASLTGFAETVNKNNFTMGQAAVFTQQFAKSVGVVGVNAALDFASNLADQNGADMMRRFGLEFGEVAGLAGEYLDSVRNLGQLDRMNRQQLNEGMDDFMSTVVSTSNIMKINLEDAAQVIKETLSRDDISSLLATMDPAQAAQVQEVVGMAGGMDSKFGEALAKRLAAGSEGEFAMTAEFAELMADPITMGIMPLVEQLARATETGGVDAFQNALANSGSEMESFIESATAQRVMLLDNEGNEMVASINRLRQQIDKANAGFTALSADDIEVSRMKTTRQQLDVSVENMKNTMVDSADPEVFMKRLNDATADYIPQLETLGVSLARHTDLMSGVTTRLEALFTDLKTLGATAANFVADFDNDVIDSVRRNRLGNTSDGVKSGDAAINDASSMEDTSGGSYQVEKLTALIKEEESRIENSLNGQNEYWGRENAGREAALERIKQYRAELDALGRGDEFMPSQRFVDIDPSRFGVTSSFAGDAMDYLRTGNATGLAELLGADRRSRTFDMSNESVQQQMAFIEEALSQLGSKEGMTTEKMQEMIDAIKEIDTTGFFRSKRVEEREAGEVAALVGALQQLVNELKK